VGDLTTILQLIGAGIIAGGALVWRVTAFLRRRKNAEIKQLNDYVETRKRIDEVDDVHGDDPDAARRWLHERGQR